MVTAEIEPLNDRRDRRAFRCGVPALDQYFQARVGQDVRRRVATCFVAIAGNTDIAGYYTLSATSILLAELPAIAAKKLPRYPDIPAILMGRLAVEERRQGQGWGQTLLFDAFTRALRSDIAAFAFVVDAKDAAAQAFYETHGFLPLQGGKRRLFRPMSEIAALFS